MSQGPDPCGKITGVAAGAAVRWCRHLWIGEVSGTKFDWKTWLKCAGGWTIGGFTYSALVCRWSTIAYWKCVAIGTGAAAVGGMIGCGVLELLK